MEDSIWNDARRDSASELNPSMATSPLWIGFVALVVAFSLALSLVPTGVGAQVPEQTLGGAAPAAEEGSRLWYSVGLGAGSVRFTCDICASDRDPGATVQLGFGARATDQLDVGIEVGGWTREDDGVRETVKRAGLRAILRPNPASGFHLLGGAGWVGYTADELGYDAVALSVGAGWDFPLVGRWRIGNRLLLDAASWGSLRNDAGAAARDVSLSVARFEVTLLRR